MKFSFRYSGLSNCFKVSHGDIPTAMFARDIWSSKLFMQACIVRRRRQYFSQSSVWETRLY